MWSLSLNTRPHIQSIRKSYGLNIPNVSKLLLPGITLKVQWIGLLIFTAVAKIQCLDRELRSCRLHGTAKKKKSYVPSSNHCNHSDSSQCHLDLKCLVLCFSSCQSTPTVHTAVSVVLINVQSDRDSSSSPFNSCSSP